MPQHKTSSELYDHENDVYYVTFGTGEPSYCVEVDDVLVVDVGCFSNLPTGYRILNMSKITTEELPLEEIKKRMSAVLKALPAPATMDDREETALRSLDRVLA